MVTGIAVRITGRKFHRVDVTIVQHIGYTQGASELFKFNDGLAGIAVKGVLIGRYTIYIPISVPVQYFPCLPASGGSADINDPQVEPPGSLILFGQEHSPQFVQLINVQDIVIVLCQYLCIGVAVFYHFVKFFHI